MLHREGAAGFKSESNEREKVSSDAPGLSATSANKPALFRSTSAAPVIRPISASTACLTVVPGDAPRSARSTSESVSAGHLRHPFGSGSSDAHPMLQDTGAFDEGFMDLEADGVEQHAERVASLLLTGGHADTSRPLPPLLSTLVDAAHYASSTEGRTTAYPHTYAYAMFKWRVAETAADAGSDAGSLAARSMRDDRQSHGSHDSADTSAARAAPGSTNSALPRRSLASSLRSAARTEGSQTLAPGAPAPATDLEVVALYDANFQAANRLGQHGVQGLRGVSAPSIGPISYAYRWYCKRATQFVGACTHAHVPDAPALPASAAASGGVDGEVDGVTTSGRVLNRSLDPVMSERELLDMLEELVSVTCVM